MVLQPSFIHFPLSSCPQGKYMLVLRHYDLEGEYQPSVTLWLSYTKDSEDPCASGSGYRVLRISDGHFLLRGHVAMKSAVRKRRRTMNSACTLESTFTVQLLALSFIPVEPSLRPLWIPKHAAVEVSHLDTLFPFPLFMPDGLLNDHYDVELQLESAIKLLGHIGTYDIQLFRDSPGLARNVLDNYSQVVRLFTSAVASPSMAIPSRFCAKLRLYGTLLLNAVAYAVICGALEDAVEIVEALRCTFWRRTVRLRTSLYDLPERLRNQIAPIVHELDRRSFVGLSLVRGTRSTSCNEHDRRAHLIQSLKPLFAEAWSIPGFERLMKPGGFSELARQAVNGPIVMLVPSSVSADAVALIIHPSKKVIPVKLPAATPIWLAHAMDTWTEAMEHARGELRDGLRLSMTQLHASHKVRRAANMLAAQLRVLQEIWLNVARPVIQALGLKKSTGNLRARVWWCCSAHLSFLPIHAAGDGTEWCADYIVSSYTPTLGALDIARRNGDRLRRSDTKVLAGAVSQSSEPRVFQRLPWTVLEIREISRIIPSSALVALPPDEDPLHAEFDGGITAQTLLRYIPEANILHLACHGMQHSKNPLESSFILRDGPLTIERLMQVPLPKAFFAFLSACETAKGDVTFANEVIHLGSTMITAGFKSVIGTKWSMDDVDGPVVAKMVYERLFEGDQEYLDPDRVPYALDEAARYLREEGHSPARWATYVHIGI